MAKRPRSADAIAAEAERLQARMQELKAEKRERARIERTKEQKQRTRIMMVAAGELASMVPVTALDMNAWTAFLARHADEVTACATHPNWDTQDAYDAANEYARERKAAAKAAGGRPKTAARDAIEVAAEVPEVESKPLSPLDMNVETGCDETTPERGSDSEDGPAIDCMTLEELRDEYKRARAEGKRANKAGDKETADAWYDYSRSVEYQAELRESELVEWSGMDYAELSNLVRHTDQLAYTAEYNGDMAEHERQWAKARRMDAYMRSDEYQRHK